MYRAVIRLFSDTSKISNELNLQTPTLCNRNTDWGLFRVNVDQIIELKISLESNNEVEQAIEQKGYSKSSLKITSDFNTNKKRENHLNLINPFKSSRLC